MYVMRFPIALPNALPSLRTACCLEGTFLASRAPSFPRGHPPSGAAPRTIAQVPLVDGDGRKAVIDLVKGAPASEKLMVIFDGEKRQTAYET